MSEENTATTEISLNGIEAYFLNLAINYYIENAAFCCVADCRAHGESRRSREYLDGIRGKFIQFLADADEQDEWPDPAPHVDPVYKPRNAVEAAALV